MGRQRQCEDSGDEYDGGKSAAPLVRKLSDNGIVCNVTAVFTFHQVADICKAIGCDRKGIVSVFAGRIADAGQRAKKGNKIYRRTFSAK